MYNTFLFDLDGTIIDSSPGITNAYSYAFQKLHIPLEDKTVLHKLIGPSLRCCFQEFCGFSGDRLEHAVTLYREYYSDTGLFECELYPGILELLDTLKRSGKTVILATAKPEIYAKRILTRLSIDHYFDFISATSLDVAKNDKAGIINHALTAVGITDSTARSTAVMVGDREFDILGAQQVGLDSIGVLYGFGSPAELSSAGATHIVKHAQEIQAFI